MRQRANAHAVVAALSLALFLSLLSAVTSGTTLQFDQQVRGEIHRMAVSPVTGAMKFVTVFGATSWILLCATFSFFLLWKDGYPRAAWTLAVAITGAYPIENGLKFV